MSKPASLVLLLAVVAMVLLAGVQTATAATVSSSGGELRLAGENQDEDNLTITDSGNPATGEAFVIIGPGEIPIKPGEGCRVVVAATSGTSQQVECQRAGVTRVTIDLGDGNDLLNLGYATDEPAAVSGGPGYDSISYSYKPQVNGVTISLDGVADDGPGERGDNIAGDFEELIGSQGDDRITGSDRDERISGSFGKDTIDAGAGDDFVFSSDEDPDDSSSVARDNVTCGAGDDIADSDNADKEAVDCEVVSRNGLIHGTRGADTITAFRSNLTIRGEQGDDILRARGTDRVRLVGGTGDDRLFGAGNNDLLEGNAGGDRIAGGRGNDVIKVRDGRRYRDVVRCGPGRDKVDADRRDRVAKDCEKVTRH